MKFFKSLLFFPILLAGLISFQGAWAGQKSDCRQLLNAHQYRALDEAVQSEGYEVKILKGQVNDKSRTVVLLGEYHIKGEEHSELGKKVLNTFDYYGLEGADLSKTWGGELFAYSLMSTQAISRLIRRKTHGSTVDDAAELSMDGKILDVLKEDSEKMGLHNLSSEEASKTTVEIEGQEFLASEVLDIISLLEAQVSKNGLKKVFNLEEGHVPSLSENVSSVFLPTILAVAGYSLYLLTGESVAVVSAGDGRAMGEFVLEVALGGVIGIAIAKGLTAARKDGRKWGVLRVLNPLEGLVGARDKTMVGNTISVLQEDEQIDVLLDIVGKAHLKTMAKLLKDEYGFTEVPFQK